MGDYDVCFIEDFPDILDEFLVVETALLVLLIVGDTTDRGLVLTEELISDRNDLAVLDDLKDICIPSLPGITYERTRLDIEK